MNCLISALACRPRARRRRGGGPTDVIIIAPSATIPRGPRNSSPSRSLYPVRTGDRRDSFTIFEAPQLGSNKSRGSNVWFKAGWSESPSQGHAETATPNHAAMARTSAREEDLSIKSQTMQPKAASPILPSVAPAASSAAASFPRRAPAKPARCLCSRACFSIRVALAGKIAAKARNRPPTTGPKREAISQAITVIVPPSANLIRNSYHRVSRKAENLSRTIIGMTR